jgi:hypothetical protein
MPMLNRVISRANVVGVDEVSEENIGARKDFGVDVEAAVRRWRGYADFPEGFDQMRRTLEAMTAVLGPVSSCFTLTSGRYAAVRLSSASDKVALHINHGYLWVTPAANATAASAGVDLGQELRALGLDAEHDADEGVTVRNAPEPVKRNETDPCRVG